MRGTAPIAVGVVGLLLVAGVAFWLAPPALDRHHCRANQGEAKANLKQLWQAEEAFRGKWGYYTTDLVSLEWSPEGAPRYLYGFAYPGPADLKPSEKRPEDYDDSRHDTLADEVIGERFQTNHMVDRNGDRLLPKDIPEQAELERARFHAAAVGDPEGPATTLDLWTIDEQGTLTNLVDDCR